MPTLQINLTVVSQDDPQKLMDAAATAVEGAGATVPDRSWVSMAAEIEVPVINTKTQEIRYEKIVANDIEEAKEILNLGTDEFVATAQENPPESPAPAAEAPAP